VKTKKIRYSKQGVNNMPSKGFIWGDSRLGYAIKENKEYNRYTKKWDKTYEGQIWLGGKKVRTETGFKAYAEARLWCHRRQAQHYKNMTPAQARAAYL
jgi:hypothetical protein